MTLALGQLPDPPRPPSPPDAQGEAEIKQWWAKRSGPVEAAERRRAREAETEARLKEQTLEWEGRNQAARALGRAAEEARAAREAECEARRAARKARAAEAREAAAPEKAESKAREAERRKAAAEAAERDRAERGAREAERRGGEAAWNAGERKARLKAKEAAQREEDKAMLLARTAERGRRAAAKCKAQVGWAERRAAEQRKARAERDERRLAEAEAKRKAREEEARERAEHKAREAEQRKAEAARLKAEAKAQLKAEAAARRRAEVERRETPWRDGALCSTLTAEREAEIEARLAEQDRACEERRLAARAIAEAEDAKIAARAPRKPRKPSVRPPMGIVLKRACVVCGCGFYGRTRGLVCSTQCRNRRKRAQARPRKAYISTVIRALRERGLIQRDDFTIIVPAAGVDPAPDVDAASEWRDWLSAPEAQPAPVARPGGPRLCRAGCGTEITHPAQFCSAECCLKALRASRRDQKRRTKARRLALVGALEKLGWIRDGKLTDAPEPPPIPDDFAAELMSELAEAARNFASSAGAEGAR